MYYLFMCLFFVIINIIIRFFYFIIVMCILSFLFFMSILYVYVLGINIYVVLHSLEDMYSFYVDWTVLM